MTNAGDFGLVVGVGTYRESFRDLPDATGDAKWFHQWLLDPTGGDVPPENAACLVSNGWGYPTVDAIDDALEGLRDRALERKRNADEVRRLYLFFAGHGQAQASNSVDLIFGSYNSGRLRSAVSITSYREYAKALGLFPEVLLLADCCRTSPRRSYSHLTGLHQEDGEGVIEVNSVVGYAALHGKQAFDSGARLIDDRAGAELDQANEQHSGHGHFTQALKEALTGAVKTRDGGGVTFRDLQGYLYLRVPELALGGTQVPEFSVEGQWPAEEPVLGGHTARAVELTVHNRLASEVQAEVVDAANHVVHRLDLVGGEELAVTLAPGLHAVRTARGHRVLFRASPYESKTIVLCPSDA